MPKVSNIKFIIIIIFIHYTDSYNENVARAYAICKISK
jgi:hypothetical protein